MYKKHNKTSLFFKYIQLGVRAADPNSQQGAVGGKADNDPGPCEGGSAADEIGGKSVRDRPAFKW